MSRSGFGLLVLILSAAVLFSSTSAVFSQGWSGPEVISSGASFVDFPQVAVGPEGRAVAAFTEYSEIIPGLFYAQVTYTNLFDGSAWGTAERIDVNNGDWESDDPRVAMDASGSACAAFVEWTSAMHVYFNYWDGSVWSGAGPVDGGLGRETSWPAVAMDGSGKAVAVFMVDDTYDKIFAGYWNGSAWTSVQIISPLGASTNADAPEIAMDATGEAIAVWRQNGSPNRVYARHWNGSSWADSTTIDMDWGDNALAPKVVMDGNGNALVVFYNEDFSDQRACANWWNGSSWSGGTTIDNDTGNAVTYLAAALNAKGNAVAVFKQHDGSVSRVWATHWDGSSWSGPTTIDDGAGSSVYNPVVAIDGFGRAVAAFEEWSALPSPPDDSKIYSAVYDGSSWSVPVQIDRDPDADRSANPQVAMDATGHAVVVFQQEEGSDEHVYANRYVFPARPSSTWNYDYDGDGTSEIAIFRVSTGLWAVRGVTRAYFGASGDTPVPGDYDGNGTTDIAIFRDSTGLWVTRGVTRAYFGGASDTPLPRDYDGDGTSDLAVFRGSSGLWAVRGLTRAYFGIAGDKPVPGDFRGYGTAEIGIFRPSTGLWASRAGDRVYFGGAGDLPVIAGYDSSPGIEPAIFREATGLWAVRSVTRDYFGAAGDGLVPADYQGDGVAEIGIFREATGLWALRGLTRVYFGTAGDIPVAR